MTTDTELDDAVRRVLTGYLAQGAPYTSLPLVDPSTDLLPPPTVAAIREWLASSDDFEELIPKSLVDAKGDLLVGARRIRLGHHLTPTV